MSRFRITIHADDALLWKAMTGRDETTATPVESEAYLRRLLDRAGVRIIDWREVEEER